MAFDFIHSKIVGGIGGLSVTSGSVEYAGYNGNVGLISGPKGAGYTSGSMLIRNGLIIGVTSDVTASAVTY